MDFLLLLRLLLVVYWWLPRSSRTNNFAKNHDKTKEALPNPKVSGDYQSYCNVLGAFSALFTFTLWRDVMANNAGALVG